MPSKISAKQLAANRKNAQKSTGPKTPEGKRRSSRNALKHGLLAQEVVILEGDGAETQEEFDAFLIDLCEELQPQGVVEEILVERIATCYWRLRRAQRYEVGAIRASLDECKQPEGDSKEDRASAPRAKRDEAAALLTQHEQLLRRLADPPDLSDPATFDAYEPALNQVAESYCLPPYEPPLPPVHAQIVRSLLVAGQAQPPPPRTEAQARAEFLEHLKNAGCHDAKLLESLRHAQEGLVEDLRREVTDLEARLETAERYKRFRRSRRILTDSLPAEDNLLKLVRYETMLDRQFHRALIELRRRQTIPDPPSSASSPQSRSEAEIRLRRTEISERSRDPPLADPNPQPDVPNPQSEIRNLQSPFPGSEPEARATDQDSRSPAGSIREPVTGNHSPARGMAKPGAAGRRHVPSGGRGSGRARARKLPRFPPMHRQFANPPAGLTTQAGPLFCETNPDLGIIDKIGKLPHGRGSGLLRG